MDTTDTRGADQPTPPEPPTWIAGYEIVSLLGEGGMGRVYLAREQHPPREVALKLMRGLGRDARQRFAREAELLAALEHPGIARLYAAGEADLGGVRTPWLALEYVRGSDLVTHADRVGLPLPDRLRLLIAVCRAVHHAHGRGVIHRDLKPANILVDEGGQPKVLDFGIARIGADAAGVTEAGQVLGTLPYMSPEQLSRNAASVQSDVYALGVIAYELIAGRLPYPRLSTSTLFEALDIIRQTTPPALGTLEARARGDLERVVMKALASEPERRYDSCAAFAADLERVLDHRPVEARAPTAGYLLARWVRRHRRLAAGAAIVLLSLFAATAVSLRFAWAEADARALAEQRANQASAISDFLQQMLVSADPEQALGRDLRVRDILEPAAAGIGPAGLPDAVASRLLATIGRTYAQLGDGERAATLLAEAIARALRAGGEGVAELMLEAASAELVRDQAAAAHTILDRLEREFTLDPPIRARAAQLRSHALAAQGRLDQAEAVLRAAIITANAQLAREDRTRLALQHNLSAVLQQSQQLDEAEVLAAEVLAQRIAAFGPDDPETLMSRNHIAALLQLRGDSARAEAEMRATIEARARVLGRQHPSTLTSRGNLAVLLIQGGRQGEAVELLEQNLAAWRELRGDHAGRTLAAKLMLAYALEDLGRLDAAETLLREIVATQLAEGGPSEPGLVSARNDLAMLLMKRGDPAAALPEFDGLLPWAERVLGADHAYLAIFRGNRGECLAQLDRLDEARAVLEDSHRALRGGLGAEHARTRVVAARLAAVYRRLGLSEAADALGPAAGG